MKKEAVLLLLLLLLPTAAAQYTDYLGAAWLEIQIDASAHVALIYEKENSYFDWVRVNQTFYPIPHAQQEVSSLTTSPLADIDETMVFEWDHPEEEELSFGYTAEVLTSHVFVPVEDILPFPLQDIPSSLDLYLHSYEIIDSDDPDVVAQANILAQGEDEQYVVVYKIAEWIQEHVEYSLSSMTSDVSQKASWVLENQYGVCDEITSLFIAMLRAVGIPARYVSGLAYTNYELFEEGFSPHGWAEVWFPDAGWVPFDLTYDEYGFLDSSHVVMHVSEDSSQSSTYFKWRGLYVDAKPGRMVFDESVKKVGPPVSEEIDMEVTMLGSEVDFGSYNLAILNVRNPHGYYYPTTIYAIQAKGLTMTGETKRRILLAPGESRILYFPLRVKQDLDPKFAYTFPIGFYSATNQTVSAKFEVRRNYPLIPKDEIDHYLRTRDLPKEKNVRSNVSVSCDNSKEKFYLDTDVTLACDVTNDGNVPLDNITVCLADDCKTLALGISQAETVEFVYTPRGVGENGIFIDGSVTMSDGTVAPINDNLVIEVIDRPNLEIVVLDSPGEIKYGEPFTIRFLLNKTSRSQPKDVEIAIVGDGFEKRWDFETLENSKEFAINLNSAQYVEERGSSVITLAYADGEGGNYDAETEIVVHLADLSLGDKVSMMSRKVELSLHGMNLVTYAVIALVMFIAVVSLFRSALRKKGY
ncbi:MAG: transglutaminase-like domain-containing protein [archaeon]